jgi:hypothetical protein
MKRVCISKASGALVEQSASAAAAADPVVAVAQPKKRGRVSKAERPRIDIDDEIEAANQLASVMKKLAHSAKMMERNSVRCKTRLLKKCGKVSAQDLERLAILKRCGLLPEGTGEVTSSSSAAAGTAGSGAALLTAAASSPSSRKKASEGMLRKLAEIVSKSGGADVVASVAELQQMLNLSDLEDEGTAMPQDERAAAAAAVTARGAAGSPPADVLENTMEGEEEGDDKEGE